MVDEIFEDVLTFVADQGVEIDWNLTKRVDALVTDMRAKEAGRAPVSRVFAPGERLLMLSLVRKEYRKLGKEAGRPRRHDPEEHEQYIERRMITLKRIYSKLGGNPDRMNEPIHLLREGHT